MDLLQNFYETTLLALKETKNDRLWFKTKLKLGKLYYDNEEYIKRNIKYFEEYQRNYYIKNKERILEYNSNYYYYKKFGVWDEKMKACSIVPNNFKISILND